MEQIQGELRVRIRLVYTSAKRGLLEMISPKVPRGNPEALALLSVGIKYNYDLPMIIAVVILKSVANYTGIRYGSATNTRTVTGCINDRLLCRIWGSIGSVKKQR